MLHFYTTIKKLNVCFVKGTREKLKTYKLIAESNMMTINMTRYFHNYSL